MNFTAEQEEFIFHILDKFCILVNERRQEKDRFNVLDKEKAYAVERILKEGFKELIEVFIGV